MEKKDLQRALIETIQHHDNENIDRWNAAIEHIRSRIRPELLEGVDEELLLKVFDMGAVQGARTMYAKCIDGPSAS